MGVYTPAEDTFFLIRVTEELCRSEVLRRCCEIGTGTGVIAGFLASRAKHVIATDISVEAVWEAKRRLSGCVNVDLVCCDGLSALREGELFDLVVFNPPYLPGSGDPTVCGGPRGVEVALGFVRNALARLGRGGVIVFILSTLGDIEYFKNEVGKLGVVCVELAMQGVGLYERLIAFLGAREGDVQ